MFGAVERLRWRIRWGDCFRPAGLVWSPGRLAMITVLQAAENLTDVQAAEAVRTRLDWKYCLGLELADRGLDDSVLSEFRTRLAAHGLEARVMDLLVAKLVGKGLL